MTSEEEYFGDDDLALQVWKDKYQLNNESLDEFFERIASHFSRLDNFERTQRFSTEEIELLSPYGQTRIGKNRFYYFLELFKKFKFIIPGGSVLSGIGSDKPVSLSNCFVVKTNDSIGPIFDAARDMAEIYKRRGGVGVDLSILRPNGAPVNNSAKTTSGVVPFMELYSQVTNTIGQAGRRGALMLSLDINHPDSPDFVKIKQDLTKVTGANVSVKLNGEFMEAAKYDKDYILRWPCNLDISHQNLDSFEYNELVHYSENDGPIGYLKKIKAKELWESIIHCAWKTAEPGILFWDNIIERDPASVYEQFRAISTNPCGEIPLSAYDSCRLIATNLYGVVDNPFTDKAQINEELLYKVCYEAQIIGDILVDLEAEAVQRIIDITTGAEKELWEKVKQIGLDGRRTGVGLTGLADMLAAIGRSYDSFDIIDEVMAIKMGAELDATIDLAIINAPFPAYKGELEWGIDEVIPQNDFYDFLLKQFPDKAKKMQNWGRRNISWSTIAPTGTISILAGISSGCEPVFNLYYTRRKKCNPDEIPDFTDQNRVGFKNFNVVHGKFKTWYSIKFGQSADELSTLTPEALKILIAQSPWYNSTAEDLTPSDRVSVQSILQTYTTHSISSTVNVANDATEEQVAQIYNDAYYSGCKGITVYRDGSRSGILVKNEEPKKEITVRPIELECRVMRFKNEKKNWIAFVGILNDTAYEIFSGVNDIDELPIPSYVESGKIIKIKTDEGSRYDFSYIDKYGYANTVGGLNRVFDKEFWNYGRFVSSLLIEKVPIQNIIKIINKLDFTNKGMNNWKSGIIRALKVFVPDGTKAIGTPCENCGRTENVVYEGGCLICKDCGTSHCS